MIVRCFLTGVQTPIEGAFVLNRRDAGDLVAALDDRVASLRRIVEQVSTLDDAPGQGRLNGRDLGPRKKHRLLCKAAADTLMQAFPEIKLFMPWLEYQAQASESMLATLRAHPIFGQAIKALSDDELRAVEKLGRAVLRRLDPERALPRKTRLAVVATACVAHRGQDPAAVAQRVKAAALEDCAEGGTLGLTLEQLRAVRAALQAQSDKR